MRPLRFAPPSPGPAALAFALLLAAAVTALAPAPARADDIFDDVPRVVAIGDVHGDYDQFVTLLRQAGLVDSRNRWQGGKAHLVQTGDVVDRGAESKRILDLLMDLEKQAAKAGGRVHALLGNHEVMNMSGNLHYVSAGEFEAFRTIDSEAVRDRAFDLLADPARRNDAEYRKEWNATHPLGWVEHRQAFGPKGRYGKWLRQHNIVVRVNGMLFAHGGIGPKYVSLSLRGINDRARQELNGPELPPDAMVRDEEGPLWYRGFARASEAELGPHLDGLFAATGARRIAIGHTVVAPAIVPRANGRVLLLDVGISKAYGGPPACLIVEGPRLFALHRGQPIELPSDGELRAYLQRVAALDPSPSPLLKVIDELAPMRQP